MRLALVSLFCLSAWAADTMPPEAEQQLAREIYKQMIEVKSGFTTGSTTPIAESVAARFRAAGFPVSDVFVSGPIPTKANVVVRYRGTGARKPILLLAHIDVVEARREDWTVDPFVFLERDGYFYGRGTADDKAQAAVWVANLIRFKQEGYVPERDLIVALTADEEGGTSNGVAWLLEHHRALIDAEYGLNEGGDGEIKNGTRVANEVQAAEKVYHSIALEARNPGGHSSLPRRDHAIYQLAAALTRLAGFEFPVELNDVTRGYFSRMAQIEKGQTAADMKALAAAVPDPEAVRRLAAASPLYNSVMRTTCVATQLSGGHAENALPQAARAVVNCRILPGTDPATVERALARVIADPGITMSTVWKGVPSPASPLRPDLMAAVDRHTAEMWPGVVVVPVMATGATDGVYLRNASIPVYGVSGFFLDLDDVRAHGRDERIGVREFYEGREFLYRLVKTLSAAR